MPSIWFAGTSCAFMIAVSALKEPIPTKKVALFNLTIEKHYESDKPSIKATFTSLDPTKSLFSFLGHAVDFSGSSGIALKVIPDEPEKCSPI